jgi:hypothetical protein
MPQMTPSEEFAFTTRTFDAEYLMQICRGNEVIVTVGTPAGGSKIERFCVWAGEGIDENNDELNSLYDVFTGFGQTLEENWVEAVKAAYIAAIAQVSHTFFSFSG